VKVGVLALQGAFVEHEQVLTGIGVEAVEVRLPHHLEDLGGLILPGGESTTIGQVAERWGLLEPMREFARSGRPLLGTCAGMIMLAKDVVDAKPGQPLLSVMDVRVRRNAFGRQVDSFEAELAIPILGEEPFPAVFIRAPKVESAKKKVEVLAELEDGTIVAVRQGNLLATAFHPELSPDDRFHRFFVGLV
jgi:5'-phosphate synthase pdxT subunit